jgi:hypothetical protein
MRWKAASIAWLGALVGMSLGSCAPRASSQASPHFESDAFTCRFVEAYVRIPFSGGWTLQGSGWIRPDPHHTPLDPAWVTANVGLRDRDPELKGLIDAFADLPEQSRPWRCSRDVKPPWRGIDWRRIGRRPPAAPWLRGGPSTVDAALIFERPYFSSAGRYAIIGRPARNGAADCSASVVENRHGVWQWVSGVRSVCHSRAAA